MKPKLRRLQFFSDEDNGWLRVHRLDLHDLEIADKIGIYSSEHGDWIYLDEYVDAALYTRAAQENDWNLIIGFQDPKEYSLIQDMEPYRYDPRLQLGRGEKSLVPPGRSTKRIRDIRELRGINQESSKKG